MPLTPPTTQPIQKQVKKDANQSVEPKTQMPPEKTYISKIPTFTQALEILKNLLPKPVEEYRDAPLQQRFDALHARMGDEVFVRIFKEESVLEVWIKTKQNFELLKTYPICAYSGGLGPKLKEGDEQAPEGFYQVDKRALNPNSKFHLAFNLGYPNAYDRAHGRTGSFLMVHGNCVSVGCYAMTDARIEEIYALVEAALDNGEAYVPVHIFPFRMTKANLMAYHDDRWSEFWGNLQEGYDYFEAKKRPPQIDVCDKCYAIHEGLR